MAKNKPYFTPVDTKVNFSELEKKLLRGWYKDCVVKRYLDKNNDSKKYFSFLDGPITANNPMGVHHAWGRTYKDLWQRYKNMQGFRQRFQNGFDCQGLWVEVEVEKELGFKNKKDIETFGIANFVNKCKERVEKYSQIQTEQSKRLGYFMDWDHSYFTMSEDNNYMIWHFLKKCYENGWIYKGNESIPWCPRCETAISQHEMLTEDYKEVTHRSIYFALSIIGRQNEHLLVWTTTPWTLPANIAVAVDKDLNYILVEGVEGRSYWVVEGKENLVSDKPKVFKKVKGEKLVGLKYEGPFDTLSKVKKIASENQDKFHAVITTDPLIMPISVTEGTGLVHTAVSAGTEDFKLGKKLGLPMIPVIEDNADYMSDLDFLSGQNAKKHPEIILDYLIEETEKGKPWVFKIENYTHRYPACWRCKTELVWKVAEEWYIAMDKPSKLKIKNLKFKIEEKRNKGYEKKLSLRERMIRVAKEIKWMPEFGLERELDWLNNMHDWLISKKNRYWGLALPIYDCQKCGNFEVIGGRNELKERAIEGWEEFEGNSPHKPWIDEVKIRCSKCGAKVSRILDVGNPWLDAGIVPYSTISEDNKSKPMYMEDKSEWKKWFPADFITESFPGQFKNWFYSMIAMSSVLENTNPFKTVLGFATLLAEDGRPMHKSWDNAIEFNEGAEKIGVDVMRWMYARQDPSQNLLFGYKVADEVRRSFHLKIWNIYNFFVTYANLNGWKPAPVEEGVTLNSNLLDAWLAARLRDTITETTKSLDRYDSKTATESIESFVDDMSNWYIRRSRERANIYNQNSKERDGFFMVTHLVLLNLTRILAPFTPFIAETIYKNISSGLSVHLTPWWDDKSIKNLSDWIGEEKDIQLLLAQMQVVRNVTEKAHSERKEKGIPVKQPLASITVFSDQMCDLGLTKLIEDELNVKKVIWKKGRELKVKLDTKITPELEEEAKTRELIRKVQQKRKDLGIKIDQGVSLTNNWYPKNKNLLERLKKITLAKETAVGEFRVEPVSSKNK